MKGLREARIHVSAELRGPRKVNVDWLIGRQEKMNSILTNNLINALNNSKKLAIINSLAVGGTEIIFVLLKKCQISEQ